VSGYKKITEGMTKLEKSIVVLHYYEGLTFIEVAAVLELPFSVIAKIMLGIQEKLLG